jgi:phosphoribosylformylglycinamidine (FGAM) synthase-like enzyme
MAGQLGLELDLSKVGKLSDETFLFSESNARFLITTSAGEARTIEKRFHRLPCLRVGATTVDPHLRIRRNGRELVDIEISRMTDAFKRTLADV